MFQPRRTPATDAKETYRTPKFPQMSHPLVFEVSPFELSQACLGRESKVPSPLTLLGIVQSKYDVRLRGNGIQEPSYLLPLERSLG